MFNFQIGILVKKGCIAPARGRKPKKNLMNQSVIGITIYLFCFLNLSSFVHAQPVSSLERILFHVEALAKELSPQVQIHLFSNTAYLHAGLDNHSKANHLFQDAIRIALNDTPVMPAVIAGSLKLRIPLLDVAFLQTKAGDMVSSRKTRDILLHVVNDHHDEVWKLSTLETIGLILAKRGDREGAHLILKNIHSLPIDEGGTTPSIFVVDFQLALARLHIQLGEKDAALPLLVKLKGIAQSPHIEEWLKDFIYRNLLFPFAELGKFDEVETLVNEINQETSWPGNLLLSREDQKIGVYLEIAKALWGTGVSERAQLFFRKAKQLIVKREKYFKNIPGFSSEIWSSLAHLEANMGNIEKVLLDDKTIPIKELTGDVLLPLVEEYLKTGMVEKVQQIVSEASVDVIAQIIVSQVNRGDETGAIQNFELLKRKLDSLKMLPEYFSPEYAKVYHPEFLKALQATGRARVNVWGSDITLKWAEAQSAADLKAFALLGAAEGIIKNSRNGGH